MQTNIREGIQVSISVGLFVPLHVLVGATTALHTCMDVLVCICSNVQQFFGIISIHIITSQPLLLYLFRQHQVFSCNITEKALAGQTGQWWRLAVELIQVDQALLLPYHFLEEGLGGSGGLTSPGGVSVPSPHTSWCAFWGPGGGGGAPGV